MSSPTANSPNDTSRITHGAVVTLAYLHETDATCSDVTDETSLSRSACYRWLTELEAVGILTADPIQRDKGRPVMVYHLDDEDLGAAAQVLVDRLSTNGADP